MVVFPGAVVGCLSGRVRKVVLSSMRVVVSSTRASKVGVVVVLSGAVVLCLSGRVPKDVSEDLG